MRSYVGYLICNKKNSAFSRIVIVSMESYMNWKNVMHIPWFVAGTPDMWCDFAVVIVDLDVKVLLLYWAVEEELCNPEFCFTRWVVFWLWYDSELCRLYLLRKLCFFGILCNRLWMWVSGVWLLVCYFIILCFMFLICWDRDSAVWVGNKILNFVIAFLAGLHQRAGILFCWKLRASPILLFII